MRPENPFCPWQATNWWLSQCIQLKSKGPAQYDKLSAVITCEHQTPFLKPPPFSLPTNLLISHQSPETSPQDQVIPPLSHISQMTDWFLPMCHFPMRVTTVQAVLNQGVGSDRFSAATTWLHRRASVSIATWNTDSPTPLP